MTVTWNSGDKTANVTLSNGNLTATMTSSSYGGVRANTSITTAKTYFEFTVDVVGASNVAVGFANATASLATYIGVDTNSWAYFYYTSSTNIWCNNSSTGTTGNSGALNSIVGVAFDPVAKLVWVRVDGIIWNNNLTADPATGSGGISVSALASGPYFPVFNSNLNAKAITANFGASDFYYTTPSGFSGLDTDVQAYNASAKFLGYDVLSPPQTTVSSAKFVGFDVLSPPQTGASASKFLAYAVLQPLTATPYAQGFVYG